MAYEQTGPGFSAGVLPNYAQEDEQIQQGLAHRFDQYTNPFLLAKGIQDVTLPYISEQNKSDYQRASLNLDQQRQNLAQTAQNTLLPLQADQLQAKTAGLTANAAIAKYSLNRTQDADNALPGVIAAAGRAIESGDTAAFLNAWGQSPAAMAKYPQVFQAQQQYLDKNNTLTEGVQNSASAAKGTAFISNKPDASQDDIANSWQDDPTVTPLQNRLAKAAYLGAANQKQAQLNQVSTQAANAQILAKIKSGATITAAEVRAIGQGIRSEQTSVDQVESIAPGLGQAALNPNPTDYTPNPNALPPPVSRYPLEIQSEALKNFNATMKNPGATYSQRQAAQAQLAAVSPALAQTMGQAPDFDPVRDAQLQNLDVREKAADTTIGTAESDPSSALNQAPMFSGLFNGGSPLSPYQQALKEKQSVTLERAQLLKQQTNKQMGNMPIDPSQLAPRPTFSRNRFLPLNGQAITTPYDPQAADTDVTPPPVVVPGNPLTTNALDSSDLTGSNNGTGQITITPPANAPAVTPVKSPVNAIPLNREQLQAGIRWLQAHPDDAEVRAKLKANGVKGL